MFGRSRKQERAIHANLGNNKKGIGSRIHSSISSKNISNEQISENEFIIRASKFLEQEGSMPKERANIVAGQMSERIFRPRR